MLLDDLATLLEAAGVGVVGTTLFKSRMPATPDTAVAIFEYGGSPPERRMSATPGNYIVERPSLQVLCRSTDYPTARTLAETAFRALDGYRGTLSGRRYWVAAHQSPYLIQRDTNERDWIGFGTSIMKTAG